MTDKQKSLIFEFMRYVVVGGVAFLADAGTMALVKELFFKENCTAWEMALCVAAGFVVGLAVNYLLSNLFVFRSAAQREKGPNARRVFDLCRGGADRFRHHRAVDVAGRDGGRAGRAVVSGDQMRGRRHRADLELYRTKNLCI